MDMLVQAFGVPKLGNAEEEYEDAVAYDIGARRFAVADGATESSYADIWARGLVRKYTEVPPLTPPDQVPLEEWLSPLQDQWHAGIRWDSLPWFAEEKARRGAFAALLGVSFAEPPPHRKRWFLWDWILGGQTARGPSWQAVAIGDCCLFQVRAQQLLKAFPLDRSSAFNARPLLICSSPSRNQPIWSAVQLGQGDCQPGDKFFLATDALSCWFLAECEAGRKPWESLASLRSREDFAAFVDRLRKARSLKNDDTTLLVFTWPERSSG